MEICRQIALEKWRQYALFLAYNFVSLPFFGTSFLREPLTRPRPATLCQSLPRTHHHHIEYKKPTVWVALLFLAVIDICDYFNDVLNNEGMFSLKKSSRGSPSGPTMNELTIFFSNFFMNAW